MFFTYPRPLSKSVLVLWSPSSVPVPWCHLYELSLSPSGNPCEACHSSSQCRQNGHVKQPLFSSAPHGMEVVQVSQGKPRTNPMADPQMQQAQEDVRQSDRKVGDILTQDSCRVCCQGGACWGWGQRSRLHCPRYPWCCEAVDYPHPLSSLGGAQLTDPFSSWGTRNKDTMCASEQLLKEDSCFTAQSQHGNLWLYSALCEANVSSRQCVTVMAGKL